MPSLPPENTGRSPQLPILYFVPDKKKGGGSLAEIISVTVRLIDTENREIILARKEKRLDEDTIRLDDVADMQGAIFSRIESGLFDTV